MSNEKVIAASAPIIKGFDHIELFVGNVRHAAHYYHTIWGFQPLAFRTAGSAPTDRTSIVMRQGELSMLLTGAAEASSPVAEHLRVHGEGVVTVGLAVDDAEAAYETAVAHGAAQVMEPMVGRDDDGEIARAEVRAFSGFTFAFVERSEYRGPFFPGFQEFSPSVVARPVVQELDHVAVAVEAGTLDGWVNFYKTVFGFELVYQEDVATEQTGMKSKVVQHPSGTCRFPLVEPALGRRKSQVQAFLDYNNGPGVQHLAFRTLDIADAVSRLRAGGVEFLRVPSVYYDELESRVGSVGEELSILRKLGILVDHDEWGRLLQLFARPCHDRPTLFFEIIERRGARGFGGGNIRALFESIEREQAS